MDDHTNLPSLLPYLEPESRGFHLELGAIHPHRTPEKRRQAPFHCLGTIGPFGRTLAGRLVTDAGSCVRPMILFQQADLYLEPFDELWPTCNPDVDRLWQRALERSTGSTQVGSRWLQPLTLSAQTDEKGKIQPFAPLFHCVRTGRFFHPPCPRCLQTLRLCRDDDLLSASGIDTYAKSLRRYLYCRRCSRKSDAPEFYALQRQADDPPTVVDFRSLCDRYGRMAMQNSTDPGIPCPDCEEQRECFGDADPTVDRIVPFSFYPFHLMIFEGRYLQSRSFMEMLSGKPIGAVKANDPFGSALGFRNRSPGTAYIFSPGSRERFLETLYLKLVFVAELMEAIPLGDGESFRFPLTLENIWVRLPSSSGRLPWLWNFHTVQIDLGLAAREPSEPGRFPPAYGRYFLGDVWLTAMLANSEQEPDTVRRALLQCRADMARGLPLSQAIANQDCRAVFDPSNLFWQPADASCDEEIRSIWQRSLDLGAELWMSGAQASDSWSPEAFKERFQQLCGSVHSNMFARPRPAVSDAQPGSDVQPDSDDAGIRAVLEAVALRWRREMPTAAPPPNTGPSADADVVSDTAESSSEDDDMPKTVVLSGLPSDSPPQPAENRDSGDQRSSEAKDDREPADETVDEAIFQQTVILRASDLEGANFKEMDSGPAERESEDSLPETVILSAGMVKPNSKAAAAERREEDPGQGHRREAADSDKDATAEPEEDDGLLKTVILKPERKKKP